MSLTCRGAGFSTHKFTGPVVSAFKAVQEAVLYGTYGTVLPSVRIFATVVATYLGTLTTLSTRTLRLSSSNGVDRCTVIVQQRC